MHMKIELKKIGVIHSPYSNKDDSPRQGRYSDQIQHSNNI